MTLLADVVPISFGVGDTSSRSQKIALLADLLRALDAEEVPVVAGFLSGVPRQGRVGVGYSTVFGLDVSPAGAPSVAVCELDAAIGDIQRSTGSGSSARRRDLLAELLS